MHVPVKTACPNAVTTELEDEKCCEHAQDECTKDMGGANLGYTPGCGDHQQNNEPHEIDADAYCYGSEVNI